VAQAAGSGATKNTLQVTGAASVTAVGVGQRIEQLNSYDLAGSTCTLSVNMSNSLLTTVTWTASYATSADTWSSKTQIATGTFTVSGTLANYSAQIIVPAAATTGIEILFTVGAQISGTWVIGNAQLEKSSTVATTFDFRSITTEAALCQRYYQVGFTGFGASSTNAADFRASTSLPVVMRATPTIVGTNFANLGFAATSGTFGFSNNSIVETRTATSTAATAYFQSTLTISAEL
jgi:hypothetical protein